jgi:hypothetical protein
MGYRVTTSDPIWTADNFQDALERGVAAFAKANGITTQTGWNGFIAALTQAQTIACMKQILGTVTCSNP